MSRSCEFCSAGEGSYTCPRCNKDYCGLKCYQSVNHQRCSEDFYQECVKAEMVGDNLSDESKSKMQQVLRRMAASNEQEYQDDEDEDSDDDEDEDATALAERLAGIDLDDADKVWEKLTPSERRDFDQLLSKGDVASLLPQFTPWWKLKVPIQKIQELDAPKDEEFKNHCPEIWENIPKLSELFGSKEPSPLLKFSVLNLLYSYAYGVRFLYGDHEDSLEFIDIVESLVGTSGSLAGVNYDLADTAVEAAASAVNLHTHLAVSLDFSRSVKQDVYDLIKGPSPEDPQYYLLASLSDLREQFINAIKLVKKKVEPKKPSRFAQKMPELDPKVLKTHLKKIEFYISWASEYFYVFNEM